MNSLNYPILEIESYTEFWPLDLLYLELCKSLVLIRGVLPFVVICVAESLTKSCLVLRLYQSL